MDEQTEAAFNKCNEVAMNAVAELAAYAKEKDISTSTYLAMLSMIGRMAFLNIYQTSLQVSNEETAKDLLMKAVKTTLIDVFNEKEPNVHRIDEFVTR